MIQLYGIDAATGQPHLIIEVPEDASPSDPRWAVARAVAAPERADRVAAATFVCKWLRYDSRITDDHADLAQAIIDGPGDAILAKLFATWWVEAAGHDSLTAWEKAVAPC